MHILTAHADTIRLNNGKKLDGKITAMNVTSIKMTTHYGEMTIKRDSITAIFFTKKTPQFQFPKKVDNSTDKKILSLSLHGGSSKEDYSENPFVQFKGLFHLSDNIRLGILYSSTEDYQWLSQGAHSTIGVILQMTTSSGIFRPYVYAGLGVSDSSYSDYYYNDYYGCGSEATKTVSFLQGVGLSLFLGKSFSLELEIAIQSPQDGSDDMYINRSLGISLHF